MLRYQQTLVVDAYPATVRPLWRLACELAASSLLLVPLGHLDLADAALRLPAAASQLSLPRLRWPSLWCWTTASTIFCVASALQCGWPSWMTLASILPFHI